MNRSTYQPNILKNVASIYTIGNTVKFNLSDQDGNFAQAAPILSQLGIKKDIYTLMEQINQKASAMVRQALVLFGLTIFLLVVLLLIWLLDFQKWNWELNWELKTFLTLFVGGIFMLSIIGICHSINRIWRQDYLILISDFNANHLSQGISLNWISLLSDAHTNQGFHVMVNIEQRRQYCTIHPEMWSTFETTQNSPELLPPVTELALDFSSTLPSFDRVSSEVQPNPIIDSTELPPSYDEVTRSKTLYVHNI